MVRKMRRHARQGRVARQWWMASDRFRCGWIKRRPPRWAEPLYRAKARFIRHPIRPFDPIAKVDIGQTRPRRTNDVVKDDKSPKPAPRGVIGLEKAIDHRQPVSLAVGQACADQPARFAIWSTFPIFDNACFNRRMFDHRRKVAFAHVRHPALWVA